MAYNQVDECVLATKSGTAACSHTNSADGNCECGTEYQWIWADPRHIDLVNGAVSGTAKPNGNYASFSTSYYIKLRINGVWSVTLSSGSAGGSCASGATNAYGSSPGAWTNNAEGWDNVDGIKGYTSSWAYSYEGDNRSQNCTGTISTSSFHCWRRFASSFAGVL